MAKVSREKIEDIIRDLNRSGNGEVLQVADWLDTLLRNKNGSPDKDDLISSLEELKDAADGAITRIRISFT